MPQIGPKKIEYPPLQKVVSQSSLPFSYADSQKRRERRRRVLYNPRTRRNSQYRANILPAAYIHVFREQDRQVIPHRRRVRRDVGDEDGERPAEASEELRGSVVPEFADLEGVPGADAVYHLRGGGDYDAEDTGMGVNTYEPRTR